MKHQITTSVTIDAPVQKVWEVFSNFKSYPQWNPFIKSIEGTIAKGEKFNATIGTMKFKPTVEVYEHQKEFTWLGRLFLPRIFDGRHSFVFEDNGNGSTTMIQKESFRGLLVGLMKKKLNTEIVDGFIAMNKALKQRVEALQIEHRA